jgi:hypothetical protein
MEVAIISYSNNTVDRTKVMLSVKRSGPNKNAQGDPNKPKSLVLPSFSKLACERKFDVIDEILCNDKVPHISWLFSENCKSDFPMQLFQQQQLPLHTLLKHNPPVQSVELMLLTLKEHVSATSTDLLGRTPLHAAVQSGCNVDVIELLLTQSRGGALGMTRDYWGRSPLHWAVAMREQQTRASLKWCTWMSGTMKRHMRSLMESLETRVMTVHALVQAYPEMVHIRDADGRTPLELAVDSNADRSLQYLLLPGASSHLSKGEESVEVTTEPTTATETVFEMTVECDESVDDVDVDDTSTIGSGGISKFFRSMTPPPMMMMMMPMPSMLSLK